MFKRTSIANSDLRPQTSKRKYVLPFLDDSQINDFEKTGDRESRYNYFLRKNTDPCLVLLGLAKITGSES